MLQVERVSDALFNKLWYVLEKQLLEGLKPKDAMHLWVFGMGFSSKERYGPVTSDSFGGQRVSFAKFEARVAQKTKDGEWWAIFDFMEFCLRLRAKNDRLEKQVNGILQSEASAYRLVDGKVVPITDPIEIATIAEAFEVEDIARIHIRKALDLFSQKPIPDFENTVKEAVTALESLAKEVTGEENGKIRVLLKRDELSLHPALQKAISSFYGWACDEDGVRHGAGRPPEVTYAEAKFSLVISSGIINLIREQALD